MIGSITTLNKEITLTLPRDALHVIFPFPKEKQAIGFEDALTHR